MGFVCVEIFSYVICNFGFVFLYIIMVLGIYVQIEINVFNIVMDFVNLNVEFNDFFFLGKNMVGVIFVLDFIKMLVYNGIVEVLIFSIN